VKGVGRGFTNSAALASSRAVNSPQSHQRACNSAGDNWYPGPSAGVGQREAADGAARISNSRPSWFLGFTITVLQLGDACTLAIYVVLFSCSIYYINYSIFSHTPWTCLSKPGQVDCIRCNLQICIACL